MPRKSLAALSAMAVDGCPPRLDPPSSLPKPERRIFETVVNACDSRHFRASDLPLLVRYVEACALGDEAAQHLRIEGAVVNGKASPWIIVQEKAVRAMVALALRLRLAPQSRVDPKTLARNQPVQGRRPWET